MAEKNSFVFYNEWAEQVSIIADAEGGAGVTLLFSAIHEYLTDGETTMEMSPVVRLVFNQIRAQLADLHLTVKDNWQIFPVEVRGIDFLGFVFRHGYVLLRKRIKQRIFKALRRLRNSRLSIKARRMAVGSYIGWLKYTNSKHLIQTFNSFSYVSIF